MERERQRRREGAETWKWVKANEAPQLQHPYHCEVFLHKVIVASGTRQEGKDGPTQQHLPEHSMKDCGVDHVIQEDNVLPSDDEAITVLTRLVQRLSHTTSIIVEAAPMYLVGRRDSECV